MSVVDVAADLAAEHQALDDLVSGLDAAQWELPTASPRWSVRDQIGHLTYFDHTAALAITDPDAFRASLEGLAPALGGDGAAVDDLTLGPYREMSAAELLDAWRRNRAELGRAASTLEDDTRVIWYGPSMGAKSFVTARLMECWAHGTDVADTVGATLPASDRLRHIAQLGFITRGWTYANRGADRPDVAVRVELTSPSGATWIWGDDDAPESVTGPAEDFCHVVTQRRHVDDTALVCDGDAARDWMLKSQAFAGAATDGPQPARG